MAQRKVEVELLPPFGPPMARGISLPLLSAEEIAGANSDGLLLLDIDPSRGEPTNAIVPLWSFGREDTRVTDWTVIPRPGEDEARQEVYQKLLEELRELWGADEDAGSIGALLAISVVGTGIDYQGLWSAIESAMGFPAGDLSDEEKRRAWEIWWMAHDLATRAFWEEKVNLFGDTCAGLYRGCSTANAAWELRSNRNLDTDRPFTIHLHRAMPDDTQVSPRFRIAWGDWLLQFTKDTEATFARFNAALTERERSELLEQIDDLEDGGRPVRETLEEIEAERQAAATLKKQIERENRNPTANEEAEFAAHTARIDELKDEQRGLEREAQEQRDALAEELFLQVETIEFTEPIETWYGVDVPMTFVPHRRGFVSLHIGRPGSRNYWVFQDKARLEERSWSSMWQRSHTSGQRTRRFDGPLTLSSNGGACWFRFSYAIPRRYCTLRSGLHRAERNMLEVSSEDLVGLPYWDPIPAGWDDESREWTAPTASILARIIPENSPGDWGRYRWQIELETDGTYLPIVYGFQLTILAEPRDRSEETPIWNSRDFPGCVASASPRTAAIGEAIGWDLTVFDADGSLAAALGWCHNRQLIIRDAFTGRVLFTGVVTEDPAESLGPHGASYIEIKSLDRTALLTEDTVDTETPADGMVIGDYIRLFTRERGFHEDEILVQDCAETRKRLPWPDPGEKPKLRPEWGSRRWEFLTSLFEQYQYGIVRYFDDEGRLRWEQESTALRDDIMFTGAHVHQGDRRVMGSIREYLDLSETYNDFFVIGGEAPGRQGRPVVARFTIYEAISNPRDIRYTRTWRMKTVNDSTLRFQREANLAVRRQVQLYGWPKWIVEFDTHYQDDIGMQSRFWIRLARPGGHVLLPVKVLDIPKSDPERDQMSLRTQVLLDSAATIGRNQT